MGQIANEAALKLFFKIKKVIKEKNKKESKKRLQNIDRYFVRWYYNIKIYRNYNRIGYLICVCEGTEQVEKG